MIKEKCLRITKKNYKKTECDAQEQLTPIETELDVRHS